MPKLDLISAGLMTVVYESDVSKGHVCLVNATHPHHPLLIVRTDDVENATGLAIEPNLGSVIDPEWLPGDVNDYTGYVISGFDIKLTENAEHLTAKAPTPQSGCPVNDDWSDLGWLVNFRKLTKKAGALELDTDAKIAARLLVDRGTLSAYRPIERPRSGKPYKWILFNKHNKKLPLRQAFTDACLWEAGLRDAVTFTMTGRPGNPTKGTLKLKNHDISVFLFNLPKPGATDVPGEHFHEYFKLKAAGVDKDPKNPVPSGECENGGEGTKQTEQASSELQVNVLLKPQPLRTIVTITVDSQSGVDESHEMTEHTLHTAIGAGERRSDEIGPGETGDTFCMACLLWV